MKFTPFTYFALPLFVTLALVSFPETHGMDRDIFKPTGKVRYSEGWRSDIDSQTLQRIYKTYQPDFDYALRSGDTQAIEDLVKKHGISLIEPWVDPTPNASREHFYEYPIEELLKNPTSYPASSFETLLRLGMPVDGFPDYSPLKIILSKLISYSLKPLGSKYNERRETDRTRLKEYLQILVNYGTNLKKPFPDHNGYSEEKMLTYGERHTA
jgi:hypothetical protein